MTLEVLFFAQLREALGLDRKSIDIEEASTIRDVVRTIADLPGWSDVESLPIRYAVNEEFVDESHVLCDGDRLALLTPVSGG